MSDLKPEETLDFKKVNVDKVLSSIPCEEKLNEIGKSAYKYKVEEKLRKYRGGYKVIEKAR